MASARAWRERIFQLSGRKREPKPEYVVTLLDAFVLQSGLEESEREGSGITAKLLERKFT